jgi:hypothetical protein
MRSSTLALVLPLLAALTAACSSCPPEPRDWLEVGWRSPEQAFHTFQTALGANEPDLEYRTLSSSFRRREGVTQVTYLAGREELLEDRPYVRRLACATVVGTERHGEGRATLRAEIAKPFGGSVSVLVELVAEDYWELWSEGERAADGYTDISSSLSAGEGGEWIWGRAPLPEGLSAAEVSELRVGREWKIDGFRLEGEDVGPSP